METAGAIDVFKLPSAGGLRALIAVPAAPDKKWSLRVAKALKAERTVFAWPSGDKPGLRCVALNQEVDPAPEEVAAAAGLLQPDAAHSLERIDGVLSPAALAAWIDAQNETTIRNIVNSLLSPTGIIPFVGAGMSNDFGAPMWGDFLKLAASDATKATIEELVRGGKYEEAAQVLDSGPDRDRFRKLVRERLDVTVEEGRLHSGPLALLPLLTKGPVITTNFDRVLESFYEAAGKPFIGPQWIAGRQEPLRILTAIQQDAHSLIKLHGDVRQQETFTFTAGEYEESYGDAQQGKRGVLTDLGNVIYTNRPLLFLGCSLETDRTLKVLQLVTAANPYLKNYAILAAPELLSARDTRLALLQRCGIVPLWFPPDDFPQIGALLERLLERSSTQDVAEKSPKITPPRRPLVAVNQGPLPPMPPSPEVTGAHLQAVASSICQGQVVFFLGAGVNPTRLLGRVFYEKIAALLGVPPADQNRADVAQQFVDLVGRGDLSEAIQRIIAEHLRDPWLMHRLIGSLSLRRAEGAIAGPVVVFTTNYDDVLESTLQSAAIPYHLFLYQPDGAYAGRFVHRSPDGRLRAILNPDGVYKLEPEATVVVKMNGGLDPLRELPGQFVVTSLDFDQLAGRITAVLPGIVRSYLARSLLFLGHGLAEPDVRAVARYARTRRGDRPAWALQLPRRNPGFWRDSCGVEILEGDLNTYLIALCKTLRDSFGIET